MIAIYLVPAGIAFVIGAIGALVVYYNQGDWSDKNARKYTRNWLYVMAVGAVWPIGLPVFFFWHISKAVKYAFPRETER